MSRVSIDNPVHFLDEGVDGLEEGEIETEIRYRSTAVPAMWYQAFLGEFSFEKIKQAAEVGRVWGINLSRTDAIVDGERGFESLDDPESFSDRYLESFLEGKIPEPSQNEAELSAYRAAQMLRKEVGDVDRFATHLRRMSETALDEEESYEKRLCLGGLIGEGYAYLLNDSTGLDLDSKTMIYCHYTGRAAMILDDLRDADSNYSKDELELFLDSEREIIEDIGKKGTLTSLFANQFSTFSEVYRSYIRLTDWKN